MALSRKKKIIIAVAAVAVLALIIIISVFASRKDEPEVTVVKVNIREELRSTVTASGEVRPIQFINMTSEVAGRIEEIYVKAGDMVAKGQPLVRLDPTQLQSSRDAQLAASQGAINDVQNARTQVIAAENNVAQAQQGLTVSEAGVAQQRQQLVNTQIELNTAQRELKRTTELVESGVTSRSEFDAAKDRYDSAFARHEAQKIAVQESIARANQQRVTVRDSKRAVDSARISVRSSESRASQQQAILRGETSQRDKATQLAPLAGVIADIPSKVGTFAVASLSSTPLLTIADMSTINVEVKVDETEISNVEVGQPAKIKVDAFTDKELVGTVTQKTPLAVGKSATQGGLSNTINVQEAKEFLVVIQLSETPDEIRNGLRPGMSATATITTKVKNKVIAVPLQAIVEKAPDASASPAATVAGNTPQPTPADGKPKDLKGVYILENGKKVKFVPITTGITGESDIEITSGVTEGMEVITGPSRILKTLKDGTTVKIQTNKPGANVNANSG
jgi:HlyD family secretion protein